MMNGWVWFTVAAARITAAPPSAGATSSTTMTGAGAWSAARAAVAASGKLQLSRPAPHCLHGSDVRARWSDVVERDPRAVGKLENPATVSRGIGSGSRAHSSPP